jgi:hypothetical protein
VDPRRTSLRRSSVTDSAFRLKTSGRSGSFSVATGGSSYCSGAPTSIASSALSRLLDGLHLAPGSLSRLACRLGAAGVGGTDAAARYSNCWADFDSFQPSLYNYLQASLSLILACSVEIH